MRERIDSLTGSIQDLSQANRDFISQDEANNIKEREKEIKSLSEEVAKYESKIGLLSDAQERFDRISGDSVSANRRRDRLRGEIEVTEKYEEKLVELRAQLSLAESSIKDSKGIIDDVSITSVEQWKGSMLEAIAITGKAEATRWSAIKEGQRIRKEELKTLQFIDDVSKSIAMSDMTSMDAAIAKGRAQENILKKQRLSAAEAVITSATNSGKTEIALEVERYKMSLGLLSEYATDKGWAQNKIDSTELLLAQEHQKNLVDIQADGEKQRLSGLTNTLTAVDQAFSIFGNLESARNAGRKAELEADLRNSQNFTAGTNCE